MLDWERRLCFSSAGHYTEAIIRCFVTTFFPLLHSLRTKKNNIVFTVRSTGQTAGGKKLFVTDQNVKANQHFAQGGEMGQTLA